MSAITRPLAPASRYGLFALVASLFVLSLAPSAIAQESDGDGDGVGDSRDYCPDTPADAHPMPSRPGCPGGGDGDGDGVIDANDSCPYEGGRVGQDGCPLPPDRDGDGVSDQDDECPSEATNQYSDASRYGRGCPGTAPFSEPDTPLASGPSCTKKMPCIVLERRGLSEKRFGGYVDPDAVVRVKIARDARGVPARVVSIELRNVDSRCSHYDEKTREYSSTPGPEVSADIGPLALKKGTKRHVNFNSTVFIFDPAKPIRTIKGLKYELTFLMYEDDGASEAELSISRVGRDSRQDECSFDVNGYNDPVTDGVCKDVPRGDESGTCAVGFGQSIDQVYKLGQALYLDCGLSFECPPAKKVDVKVTVSKSVAKTLGLRSRTISSGDATGPKKVKVGGEKGTYYFVPLNADAERRMKSKKVRAMTVAVSGTITSPDGVRRFESTRAEWLTDGNCSGRDLKITKQLTYGGKCSSR